jgi:nicotinate phosphoribosyltransferase
MPRPDFNISDDILKGRTADVYFVRTLEVLSKEGVNPVVTMEIFAGGSGLLCGIEEALSLLRKVLPPDGDVEVWALEEGDSFREKEVVLRIKAPYVSFGLYETAILGMLAHGSGWASAARRCVDAADGLPVISFGARHVHPSVAGNMDYAAVIGGCVSCSSTIGADLAQVVPSGTMPHTLILIMGDTALATLAFDKHMPQDVPRISLVDTFIDEDTESVNVAQALGDSLEAVRLDTPAELGGVTPELVKRVRSKLDINGYERVGIFVSGGMNPDRIKGFIDSGASVDGFGVAAT